MLEKSKGWIRLPRSIQQHWLWKDQPFSPAQAWLDLMMTACYTQKKILLSCPRMVLTLPRGALYSSQTQLAQRWGWGRTKVRNFLALLQEEGLLQGEKVGNGMLYTLLCYEEWVDGANPDSTPETAACPAQGSHWGASRTAVSPPPSPPADCPEKPVPTGKKPQASRDARPASPPAPNRQTTSASTEPAPSTHSCRTAGEHIQQREEREKREEGEQPPHPGAKAADPIVKAANPSPQATDPIVKAANPSPQATDPVAKVTALPPWVAALPVVVVESELLALLSGGADRALVEWAAAVAAQRGKGWAYTQGIIRNAMKGSARETPPGTCGMGMPGTRTPGMGTPNTPPTGTTGTRIPPMGAPRRGAASLAPSYDPEEFDRRGFELPPLPGMASPPTGGTDTG